MKDFDIISILIEMVNCHINNPSKKVTEKCLEVNLLGEKVGLEARDLLLLFYEIEQRFNIQFSEETINTYEFNTINNIKNAILSTEVHKA